MNRSLMCGVVALALLSSVGRAQQAAPLNVHLQYPSQWFSNPLSADLVWARSAETEGYQFFLEMKTAAVDSDWQTYGPLYFPPFGGSPEYDSVHSYPVMVGYNLDAPPGEYEGSHLIEYRLYGVSLDGAVTTAYSEVMMCGVPLSANTATIDMAYELPVLRFPSENGGVPNPGKSFVIERETIGPEGDYSWSFAGTQFDMGNGDTFWTDYSYDTLARIPTLYRYREMGWNYISVPSSDFEFNARSCNFYGEILLTDWGFELQDYCFMPRLEGLLISRTHDTNDFWEVVCKDSMAYNHCTPYEWCPLWTDSSLTINDTTPTYYRIRQFAPSYVSLPYEVSVNDRPCASWLVDWQINSYGSDSATIYLNWRCPENYDYLIASLERKTEGSSWVSAFSPIYFSPMMVPPPSFFDTLQGEGQYAYRLRDSIVQVGSSMSISRPSDSVTVNFSAHADSDSDGIPDQDEISMFGTDPNNPDTDGDGLNDYWEVIHGTNPLSTDSDSDGLQDGWEVDHGLNPFSADTDNDGMPDGWEVQYEIYYEPDNAAMDPDSDGLTNLQEYQAGTNPKSSDTDHDGMTDGWEMTNQLNATVNDAAADADSDGLTNLQEFQAGTNPKASDTDSDGMPDGWEVANQLNPLVNDATADADGDGCSNLVEYQGGTNPRDPLSPSPVVNLALASRGSLLQASNGRVGNDGLSTSYDGVNGYAYCPVGDGMVLDLRAVCSINQIKLLLWAKDSRTYGYRIAASVDGLAWTEIVPARTGRSWQTLALSTPARARYLKLFALSNTANSGFHLVEWEVYGRVDTSVPPSTEQNMALGTRGTLLMQAGQGAVALDGSYNSAAGYASCNVGDAMMLDLKEVCLLNQISFLLWDWDGRTYGYRMEASLDGMTWTEIAPARTGRSWQFLSFSSPVQARYLKLYALSNTANSGFHVVEWQAWGQVDASVPASTLLNVARSGYGATLAASRGIMALDGILNNTGYAECNVGGSMILDLGQIRTVENMRLLFWNGDSRTYGYRMDASVDGTNWTPVCPSRRGQNWQFIPFTAPTQVRYVKLYALSNTANSGFHVVEWQVMGR